MKKLQKARRIVDKVFYFVIIVFSMYCIGTFTWLMSEVIGKAYIPNSETLEGLTSGFMVFVVVIFFIVFVDMLLKSRIDFLYKKFGGFTK